MEFTPILKKLSSLFPPSKIVIKKPSNLTIFIISPHPDDECITTSLALRMAAENNCNVVNIAVTLGSKEKRKSERLEELTMACEHLEIELLVLHDDWKMKVKELKSLIQKYHPSIILAPHAHDIHQTHIKTSKLLQESLKGLKKESFIIAWTEYWGQLKKPNLLVEVPSDILKHQLEALSMHVGEISRNPYHLRLPGWMMDNVRRGAEIIQGTGSESPKFAFGTLYQLQLYKNQKFKDLKIKPILSYKEDLAQIFKLILDAASESRTKVK
jgi:LmbE family N-acetylglucosaminyl deacetylase